MKIRILQVVTLSELGGAQKVVYHMAADLDRGKFDVTVACAPGGELVRWLRGKGIEVVELPYLKRNISPFDDVRCLWQLYRLIKSKRFDIVHCHSSKAGILGRLAAHLAGVRQIYFTVHGWGIDETQPFPVRWFYTMAERLGGAVSTGVVCVSKFDREKGLSLGLVKQEKLLVIHNGMPDIYEDGVTDKQAEMFTGIRSIREKWVSDNDDLPDHYKCRDGKWSGLRSELRLDDKDVLIGTVMRLAFPKQPLFFLELASRLSSETSARFVIIGDGPLRPECERYITENGLRESVFMLGAREDAIRLVSGFAIFTLFSGHEGLPLTVIEAMLAGVPVVASNVGGMGELVDDGVSGFLINYRDLDGAVLSVKKLLEDAGLRRRMGYAGREKALSEFTVERMISRYEQLYDGNRQV